MKIGMFTLLHLVTKGDRNGKLVTKPGCEGRGAINNTSTLLWFRTLINYAVRRNCKGCTGDIPWFT